MEARDGIEPPAGTSSLIDKFYRNSIYYQSRRFADHPHILD